MQGYSTVEPARGDVTAQAPLIERRARQGRWLLWALIANVGFAGVIGPYLLPEKLYLQLVAFLGGDYVYQGPVLAQRPWVDIGHRLLGMALLLIGMLQFDRRLRRSRPVLHRWSGRLFLCLVLVVGGTALIMGIAYPFGGPPESIFVITVSVILLWCAANAWREALRRRFPQHREWMIRTLGLCFFVSVQRLFFMPMVVVTDWPDRELFVITNSLAAVVALIASEYWIRLTRTATMAKGST